MECDALDLHRNYIEDQKLQIEFANNLIEHANGNEKVIRMANELIKSCEKSISIEQNIIGSSPTEFTLVDYPTMDDRSAMNLKSSDRLKQEVDK